MDISFLISTIRDHRYYLYPLIRFIRSLIDLDKYSYEIVVCTKEQVVGDVRWIEEKELAGPVKAYNRCYQESCGNTIIGLSDGILLSPHVLVADRTSIT